MVRLQSLQAHISKVQSGVPNTLWARPVHVLLQLSGGTVGSLVSPDLTQMAATQHGDNCSVFSFCDT